MARALENMKRPGGRVATKREVSWSHFRRDIFLPIASNSFLNHGCVSREIFSFIGQGGANSASLREKILDPLRQFAHQVLESRPFSTGARGIGREIGRAHV